MELWAFATSPYGLALDDMTLWGLTHAQFFALRRQWKMNREFQMGMFFQIRADIHNGWMPREDKRGWTAQDFGAPEIEEADPRIRRQTKEETKRMLKRHFRKKGDKSALDGLVGQPLPIPIDRKVG